MAMDISVSKGLAKCCTPAKLVTFLTLFLCCEIARSDVVIEFGSNFVQEHASDSEMVLIQKRWQNKYALSIGYMSSHCIDNRINNTRCNWDISPRFLVGGERLFSWEKWSIGLGLYFVDGTSRISSTNLNARSSLSYAISDSLAFKLSHLSNGGLGPETTACNTAGNCVTNDFNLGINTLGFELSF